MLIKVIIESINVFEFGIYKVEFIFKGLRFNV